MKKKTSNLRTRITIDTTRLSKKRAWEVAVICQKISTMVKQQNIASVVALKKLARQFDND